MLTSKNPWISKIDFLISTTGNLVQFENISIFLEIKLDNNLYLKSDIFMERNNEELTTHIEASFSSICIVFKMRIDLTFKNFQYFLKVEEELYSELKIKITNLSGYEVAIDFMPFLKRITVSSF